MAAGEWLQQPETRGSSAQQRGVPGGFEQGRRIAGDGGAYWRLLWLLSSMVPRKPLCSLAFGPDSATAKWALDTQALNVKNALSIHVESIICVT